MWRKKHRKRRARRGTRNKSKQRCIGVGYVKQDAAQDAAQAQAQDAAQALPRTYRGISGTKYGAKTQCKNGRGAHHSA